MAAGDWRVIRAFAGRLKKQASLVQDILLGEHGRARLNARGLASILWLMRARNKISALMTEEYLQQRAARGSRRKMRAVLARVPDVDPEERDKMPAALARRRRRAG